MSKSPNAAALTKIQTALGTEPIFVLEVDWDSTYSYADKDFLGVLGKILNVSGLDSIVKINGAGTTGNLSITLDDTDGTIKALWNTVDIHKRPARVYQSFEGLANGDKFLIFSGEVSSPVVWNEGERTISFDIVNVVEDKQLGFSPEEGEFDFISEAAIGVPWPLAFGNVVRVPATRITEAVRGTTLSHYGQITAPELEQLCSLAVSAQQAETGKKIADGFAGFSDENYAIVMDNIGGTTNSLNNFLDGLIFDSPTQEGNLLIYIDTCKEIERNRVLFDQELANYQTAEQLKLPLESTPGEGEVNGFRFFGTDYDKGKSTFTGAVVPTFEKTAEMVKGYRVGVNVPAFNLVYREAIPEGVGAVDAAQASLDTYIDTYWPYTTPAQWAVDDSLRDTLQDLQSQLNSANAASSAAFQFMTQANSNITGLRVTKTTLEGALLRFVITSILVDGGEKFPQATPVEIIVNGLHYKGSFSGRTFTVSEANTPADVNVGIAPTSKPHQFLLGDPTVQLKGKYCFFSDGITFVENQDGALCSIAPILFRAAGTIANGPLSHTIYDFRYPSGIIQQTSVFMSIEWMDTVRNSNVPDFATGLSILRQRDYGFDIGDTVYLSSDYKETYIANLIPSTSVAEVMAYRVVNGVRKLLPIPSRYYTVNLNEAIAGQNSTTIKFTRPLTEYFGEDWEDQIFVSLVSSVGPNTVDIIEHLVDTYTDLTKDTASFASVSTAIDPFPSSFAYLDRRSTFTAIQEIAWQARCAAYIKGSTVYLKYLAAEATEVETITESNTHSESLELTLTPTEDLITELNAEWDSDYSAEKRNKIILRNNIGKYGTVAEDFDFYIYNVQELVIKSATYWLIQLSNTWKFANFKAPLVVLRLDTFDTVLVDYQQDWIASAAVKGIVENVIYNSESYELDFSVKTSVRAGELVSYPLTWPANVSVSVEYPQPTDLYAGGATS